MKRKAARWFVRLGACACALLSTQCARPRARLSQYDVYCEVGVTKAFLFGSSDKADIHNAKFRDEPRAVQEGCHSRSVDKGSAESPTGVPSFAPDGPLFIFCCPLSLPDA